MVFTYLNLNALLGMSSHLIDFNARKKSLTAKPIQQGYRYHKLRKPFLNLNVDTFNKFLNINPD